MSWVASTRLLERSRVLGRPLPSELERVLRGCDAAVVLATPDDLGRAVGSSKESERARENVWIELGWFWAALGTERTLLVNHESVTPPSDVRDLFRLIYTNSPAERRAEIRDWLDRLDTDRVDDSIDLVRSTANAGIRNADYQLLHASAQQSLLIAGIGMINVRQDLPNLMRLMRENRALRIRFLLPSDRIVTLQEREALAPYRATQNDLATFLDELRRSASAEEFDGRLDLVRYNRFMTFVSTVADLGEPGSEMLVELPLEAAQHGLVERPRLLLRKRTNGGLYDRLAAALNGMVDDPQTTRETIS